MSRARIPLQPSGADSRVIAARVMADRELEDAERAPRATDFLSGPSDRRETPWPAGTSGFPGRRLARLVQYRPSRPIETLVREWREKSERDPLETLAAAPFEAHGWRTALFVADRARALALAGDWDAARTWHRLFELVFEHTAAMDPFDEAVLRAIHRAAADP